MSVLAFTKFYSTGEMVILIAICCAALAVLGLMANGILGSRGFGIVGNGLFIGVGAALALVAHHFLMKRPEMAFLAVWQSPLLISLIAVFGLLSLLGAAIMKKNFG